MRVITKAASHEIELFEPPPDAIYTIEATSNLVDVPRRKIMVYCKHRLLVPVINARDRGYSFDREGIRALRRIEALRAICGNDLAGIKIILELTNALERMHSEMRSLSKNNSAGKARMNSSPKG
jgi:DNA-binding transcriptional MerR regulator